MAAFRTLIFWLVALGVMVGLASWMPSGAQADALRRIERETRRDRDDRVTRRSHDDRGGRRSGRERSHSSTRRVRVEDRHDDDDDVSAEVAAAFMKLALFPWTIPHIMLEQAGEPERMELHRCLGTYARVPFQNGPGILRSRCDEPSYDEVSSLLGLSSESGFMLQQVVPASFAVGSSRCASSAYSWSW